MCFVIQYRNDSVWTVVFAILNAVVMLSDELSINLIYK